MIKKFFFKKKFSNLIFLNFLIFNIVADVFFFQIVERCVLPVPLSPKIITFLVVQFGHLLISSNASLFEFETKKLSIS